MDPKYLSKYFDMSKQYLVYKYVEEKKVNLSRLKTKEELIDLLKKYKGLLSDPMIHYLNDLINLEFSAIRNYIPDNDREALSELEIYRLVVVYNVYNRAVKLLKDVNEEFDIINDSKKDSLEVYYVLPNKEKRLVYSFDYNIPKEIKSSSSDKYDQNALKIGEISLYRTTEKYGLKEKEMERILNVLDILYGDESENVEENLNSEKANIIRLYEKNFKDLENKKELNDSDKKEVEITNEVYRLMLADYQLTHKDFDNKKSTISSIFDENETLLGKQYVKKLPHLVINNNVKYL